MKRNIISLAIGMLIAIPIVIMASKSWTRPTEKQEIDFTEYIEESDIDVESEVLGIESDTDFIPGYYEVETEEEEEFNPYPGSIVKYIEATAYCYGTTTCTGKQVREGYAAMSKRYLGMTAIVYELDEKGQPFEYMGTYEIEDTGGDYRIKNGNCIDIYIPDYDAAVEFGRKQVVVYLIEAKG